MKTVKSKTRKKQTYNVRLFASVDVLVNNVRSESEAIEVAKVSVSRGDFCIGDESTELLEEPERIRCYARHAEHIADGDLQ